MKIAMPSIETLSKILATLVILLVSTTPSRADDARHNDRIPVGVILSLTGELSPFGEALRQGIELAHADGGIKEVSFSYEDDGSGNRAMTVGALQSLIKRDHIKMAVVAGITTLVPIDPIVRKEGLLALSAFDSNAMIDTLSDSSFGYGWSNELTGEKMASFACNDLKFRRAAVVVGHDEWSEIMGASFSKTFKKCGGEIISEHAVDLSSTDFRSLTAKITRAHPEAVYFPLYGPALLPFAKQLKQSGFTGTMLSAEGISDVEVKQLGDQAEGMYITAAYVTDVNFEARYRNAFGVAHIESRLAYVALGYEMARFLDLCAQELKRKGLAPNIDNLRTVFRSVETNDILGPISFRDSKSLRRSQTIVTVKGGKLVPASSLQ